MSDPNSPESLAIQVRDLSRAFGSQKAVDRLNLSVPDGEIFGLLGPNGAGKSTTIKMLTTLLAPDEGEALVAGFSISENPADIRRSIGYVPQLLSADGNLTGRENLSFSARLYGIPRKESRSRVAEALSFMSLEEAADRPVKTYSGGMIRRLELAQAMLHMPRILFLDEPTIGLDPVARHTVQDRLRELRKNFGMTVLITTHDMEEADLLCDTIAILHRGRVAITGTPRALKAATGKKATLGDVFTKFSGDRLESGENFRSIGQTRRVAGRLG